MCFTVMRDQSLQIALEDIVCYKLFKDPTYYSISEEIFSSPYLNFDYEKGKRYDLGKELKIVNIDNINEGFHSYTNHSTAERLMKIIGIFMANGLITIVIQCIIPKGATFYINPIKNEYVSDSIIIGT